MRKIFLTLWAAFAALCFFSCASTTSVTRMDADTDTDLSGEWNDTDIRIVCEALVADCIASPRVAEFAAKNGRPATVKIGRIRNKSSEHLDTTIVANKVETAVINSGVMEFVGNAEESEAIRAEQLAQSEHASVETQAEMGNETGADFLMTGEVNCVLDTADNKQVRHYYVTLSLVNVTTNGKLWQAQKEVKKLVTQAKYKL